VERALLGAMWRSGGRSLPEFCLPSSSSLNIDLPMVLHDWKHEKTSEMRHSALPDFVTLTVWTWGDQPFPAPCKVLEDDQVIGLMGPHRWLAYKPVHA
jgi:hypothetical protein